MRRKCKERKADKRLQTEARYKLSRMEKHNHESEMPALFYRRKEKSRLKWMDEPRFYCKAVKTSALPYSKENRLRARLHSVE